MPPRVHFIIPRKPLRKTVTTVVQGSLAEWDQAMKMIGFGMGNVERNRA